MDKKREIYYKRVAASLVFLMGVLIYFNILENIYDVFLYAISSWLGVLLSIIYFNKRRTV